MWVRTPTSRSCCCSPPGGLVPGPPLAQLRGKVLLLLILDSEAMAPLYLSLYPNLKGAPGWFTQMPVGGGWVGGWRVAGGGWVEGWRGARGSGGGEGPGVPAQWLRRGGVSCEGLQG